MEQKKKIRITERQYLVPFILITTLFFMWAFARTILDLLNKHFQETLNISITQSALIQVTTYLAYFLMAIPAGTLITKYGYRRGVVFGLVLFGIGSLMFIPGAAINTFVAFLIPLFIIGCGLTFLETAANPYSTELGPRETAASRLNLSQTFNGLGAAIAPALVGGYLFNGGDIKVPYIIMGVLVLFFAIIFSRVNLPEIKHEENDTDEATIPEIEGHRWHRLWEHKLFIFGLFALLCYEIAEISINSYFINFTTMEHVVDGVRMPGLMSPVTASMWLSGALFLFMGGRFLGSIIMAFVKAEIVLCICALMCCIFMGLIFLGPGKLAIYALVANYLFEAIMFPTIFSLALRGMGNLTKTASSVLMMTPVGGCFFLLTGYIADAHMLLPFVVPFIGYLVIFFFAYTLICRKGVANNVK